MKAFKKAGYSKSVADDYIRQDLPVVFVTSLEETMYKYEDNHRTDQVTGHRYWFVQEGINPFQVKFPEKLSEGLNLFDELTFEELEGIEIRGNIYFRAQGVKPFKGKGKVVE
ncbi:hypothetical protein [Lacticaseibacillus paracasei]|uniref:hypothetical protein n=1 Tax=Lacticaseibacillus paracasei TaxID=1597 RepID=UPI003DAA1B41